MLPQAPPNIIRRRRGIQAMPQTALLRGRGRTPARVPRQLGAGHLVDNNDSVSTGCNFICDASIMPRSGQRRSKRMRTTEAMSQSHVLRLGTMDKGFSYLDELNSSSKTYSVKVKVVEKARAKPSSKKGLLYQILLLTDAKGNKMRAALFGDQIDSFSDAIVYNGEYIISNAPIKLIEEQWRSNNGELPYQMTFGGQTVVRPANSDMPVGGPIFQSIHTIPRIMIADSKYDVVGIVLYVEEKLRVINSSQGREYHVREIVVTDHTNTQPFTITAWNDLAKMACDALHTCAKDFAVVGFTTLRPSLHKGFSLSTGMSTEIIHDPKGEKADILHEWARIHTQLLLQRQEKILQVRCQTLNDNYTKIQNLREKKAHNVLQEERHWLNITIAQPEVDNIIAYIGCFSCGRRTNVHVGTGFFCGGCKKDSNASYRVTFKFQAVDDSRAMTFTTFNNDTEKLFGQNAQQIHFIRDFGAENTFLPIVRRLRTSQILVQVGPTTALSRNNVLEWCLKGIEINPKDKNEKVPTTLVAENLHTDVITMHTDITSVGTVNQLSSENNEYSAQSTVDTSDNGNHSKDVYSVDDDSKTPAKKIGAPEIDLDCLPQQNPGTQKKRNVEFSGLKTTRRKRSLNALTIGGEFIGTELKEKSENTNQVMGTQSLDAPAHGENSD
uniref:Uncharacterized protein n=1 Tax=Chenopodium quinoa TaxID=63459 RepID=A0A803LA31_CHEQI